jgi:hypothetical protein
MSSIISYLLSVELNRSMRIQAHQEEYMPSSSKGYAGTLISITGPEWMAMVMDRVVRDE